MTLAALAVAGSSGGVSDDDPTEPRPILLNADGANDAFRGVGQVEGLGPSCTGFLVDTRVATALATVITNGHCVGLFDATTIVAAERAPDGALVRFGKFADTVDAVVEIPVATVSYATMRSTDVAVLQLAVALGELVEQGVTAYRLGSAPEDGDQIRVVGIPVDGVDATQQVLRGDTCTAGPTVRLVEWEWLWDAAVASDCAGILGGNSGSPVFSADDLSTVVAVINTTTIGAGPGGSCYLGQPCEIRAGGEVEVADRTYAMPVGDWASCFATTFVPDALGCPAEPTPSVTVDAPLRAAQPGATWSATISAPGWAGDVVVKAGSAASTDCRDTDGYSDPRSIDAVNPVSDPLPVAEGAYVLCAGLVDNAGAVSTGNAGYAVMQIDATAPNIDIELVVRSEPGADAYVEPVFSPPELSSFLVKVGARRSTDCSVDEGYSIYRRVPIVVPADEQPALVCVIGEDEAGNFGEPQSFDVP